MANGSVIDISTLRQKLSVGAQAQKQKFISIKIRENIFTRLKQFEELTGIPTARTISTAVDDYLEAKGASISELMMENSFKA